MSCHLLLFNVKYTNKSRNTRNSRRFNKYHTLPARLTLKNIMTEIILDIFRLECPFKASGIDISTYSVIRHKYRNMMHNKNPAIIW